MTIVDCQYRILLSAKAAPVCFGRILCRICDAQRFRNSLKAFVRAVVSIPVKLAIVVNAYTIAEHVPPLMTRLYSFKVVCVTYCRILRKGSKTQGHIHRMDGDMMPLVDVRIADNSVGVSRAIFVGLSLFKCYAVRATRSRRFPQRFSPPLGAGWMGVGQSIM